MSKISSILIAFMMLFAIGGFASAATLNLVTKNTVTWNHEGIGLVVLTYNEAGTDFVYKLDGVVTLLNTQYTLMYYVDKEPTGTPESFVNPGIVGQVIATVMSDAQGKVATSGVKNILSMPFTIDPNGVVGANGGYPGAKVWLVPSADVVSGINWANMKNFLYEENLVANNGGIPSHLISYIVAIADPAIEKTNATLGVCSVPLIGLTVSKVDFGKLYAGEFTTTNLEVDIKEIVEDDCATKDVVVSVTVTPGAWTPITDIITTDIITTVDKLTKSVMVTTIASIDFVLRAAVESGVEPGAYTQVITVSAVY